MDALGRPGVRGFPLHQLAKLRAGGAARVKQVATGAKEVIGSGKGDAASGLDEALPRNGCGFHDVRVKSNEAEPEAVRLSLRRVGVDESGIRSRAGESLQEWREF